VGKTTTFRRDDQGAFPAMAGAPFDVAEFLRSPRVARLSLAGPVVRPVWYLWEDQKFWVITGPWSRLSEWLRDDPKFELVIDTCDVASGQVRQVIARGDGALAEFEEDRGRRKLRRYLGDDEPRWDPRFRVAGAASRGTQWAVLSPRTIIVADISFRPAIGAGHGDNTLSHSHEEASPR
jgi:hypothetical protein